jgi:uncharacterized membrane protein
VSTSDSKRTVATEQLIEAILAGAVLGYPAPRRSSTRVAVRLAGAALLVAAFAPAFTRKLLRAGAARRRVRLRTTIDIDRSVHDVFEFCRDFENFPRVVQSLHAIVDYQDGRSRWTVIAPGGECLEWDVQVTKYVPNVVIAWHAVPGSVVDLNALIRFSPTAGGGTRLQIAVDYDPCHTGLSDAVKALFDIPRTEQLEADLSRARSYVIRHAPVAPIDVEPDTVDANDAGTSAHSA